jgi:hypothetical protein
MTTHLTFWSIKHTEDTTSGTMVVHDNHPHHDGVIQMWVDFKLATDEEGDVGFAFANATPKSDRACFVCPYTLKEAMEMVLETIGSGEISTLETTMIISEGMVEINK